MTLDAVKAAVLVTLTAIVQIAFVNAFELAEGRAEFAGTVPSDVMAEEVAS